VTWTFDVILYQFAFAQWTAIVRAQILRREVGALYVAHGNVVTVHREGFDLTALDIADMSNGYKVSHDSLFFILIGPLGNPVGAPLDDLERQQRAFHARGSQRNPHQIENGLLVEVLDFL
jgi:hypothetical protein